MSDTWTYESSPAVAGWYAIQYSWDAQEGVHVGADYWTGDNWYTSLPTVAFHGPHESMRAADKYARDNDPDR